MTNFAFQQVDVFTSRPLRGNPLAVVVGADALTDTQMAAFANWTNLSETTFLLQPTMTGADYRVRIFTSKRSAVPQWREVDVRKGRGSCQCPGDI
jgi:PhzF family phenazine biosynthesis protein